jgi:Cu-Zn family superoxide dismutase
VLRKYERFCEEGYMRSVPQAIGGLLVTLACLGAQSASAQKFPEARATINSCTTGAAIGAAVLLEKPSAEGIKNVTVMVSAAGLAPGKHAVHIHEVGACTPTCAAAGSHVDLGPFGNNQPVIANHPYHSGDLINLPIANNGTGSMTHVTSRIALTPGNLSIFDADGAAIVIHALPDAYCAENPADPNCAGGGRVACGILRRVP